MGGRGGRRGGLGGEWGVGSSTTRLEKTGGFLMWETINDIARRKRERSSAGPFFVLLLLLLDKVCFVSVLLVFVCVCVTVCECV